MNCLIHFEFKGTMHKKFIPMMVYCWVHEVSEEDDDTWKEQQASETLGCMITSGLIDFYCDHGVSDFKLLSCQWDIPYNEGVEKSVSMFAMKHTFQPRKPI